MINTAMRFYDYYTIGSPDAYGQTTIPRDADPEGKVKMAISVSSQSVQDNILYQGCQYMGLTHNAEVNDTYIIEYNGERLKVLYVGNNGRLRQVFMSKVD